MEQLAVLISNALCCFSFRKTTSSKDSSSAVVERTRVLPGPPRWCHVLQQLALSRTNAVYDLDRVLFGGLGLSLGKPEYIARPFSTIGAPLFFIETLTLV